MHLPLQGKVKFYLGKVRISEAAHRAGVTAKAIRYYERIGVLPPTLRTPSGYRDYDEEVLERLSFIRSAQAMGLSLTEIRTVIDLRDSGTRPCTHVMALLERKTAEVEIQIAALRVLRRDLTTLSETASNFDPSDCRSESGVCGIIRRP